MSRSDANNSIRAESSAFLSDDPLECDKLFHVKIFKPQRFILPIVDINGEKTTREGDGKDLKAQNPELFQLVEDHLERHIRHPDDGYWPGEVEEKAEEKALC